MALQKTIATNYGVSATYWKVIEINCNWLGKVARVVLAGYLDKDARDANKQPLEGRGFDISSEIFDTVFAVDLLDENNPITQAYTHIKSLADWTDAVDV